MVIIKTKVAAEPLINCRTEEVDASQHATVSNDRLASEFASYSHTTTAPASQVELESLYQSTGFMRSPAISSTAIFTPESLIEPTIKQETSCSLWKGVLQSLPIDLQDYHEQLHCLEERNRELEYCHEGFEFENIDSNEHLQSFPASEEYNSDAGCDMTEAPNEDTEATNGQFTTIHEEGVKIENGNQLNESLQQLLQRQEQTKTKVEDYSRSQSNLENTAIQATDRFLEFPRPNLGNRSREDYQIQLMLLEQQNRKRLLLARQECLFESAARYQGDPFRSAICQNTTMQLDAGPCPLPSCSRRDHVLEDCQMQSKLEEQQAEESQSKSKDAAQEQESPTFIHPLISGSNYALEENKMHLMFLERANKERLEKLASARSETRQPSWTPMAAATGPGQQSNEFNGTFTTNKQPSSY
ncbi:hypothetical protein NHQ30_001387 [Ciborinia camelliae]|nr:hypothetical protein NHQ30_001387 [Ciborinia camelliae]